MAWLGFLTILTLGAIPRFLAVLPELPAYSIDENEIVETAVGMLGGDLDYRIYGYGPVTMYVTAGAFTLVATAVGRDLHEFARAVFFEPTLHYATARVVNGIFVVATIAVIVVMGRRQLGQRAALFGASLLALPLIESLAHFTARVDTAQMLFQTLAVLACVDVARMGRMRDYVLAGIGFGLAVASKPLPGLVTIVVVLLAHAYRVRFDDGRPSVAAWLLGPEPRRGVFRHALRRIARTCLDRRLWVFGLSSLGANFGANPYSLVHLRRFSYVQYRYIVDQSQGAFPAGYHVERFLPHFGWALCLLFVLAGWRRPFP